MPVRNKLHYCFFCCLLKFFLSSTGLHAQAVDNLCARYYATSQVDSLTWTVSNNCPDFYAYIVLGILDSSSGSIPIDTITDSNQNFFAHPNPSGATWSYSIGLLCSNSLVATSGWVYSQRPATPNIRSVSIVNNQPVLSWYASPSPNVIGYQIYKETPYGSGDYFPYPGTGMLATGTRFTDVSSSYLAARYAISAVTPCNESYVGLGTALDGSTGPHSSLLIEGSTSVCDRSYKMTWNAYENWELGVREYQVWASFNGDSFERVATVAGNQTTYTYPSLEDGDEVIFELRAYENNRNNVAQSNQLTVQSSVNRPMDFLYLTNLTVTPNASIELSWEWDTAVDFSYAEILSSATNNSYSSLQTINSIHTPGNTYEDLIHSPGQAPYYYKVRAYDACGQQKTSNYAKTIHLTGEASTEFKNAIQWTAFEIEYASLEDYQLYGIADGISQLIGTFPPNQLSYIDVLDTRRPAEATRCYYVLGRAKLNLPKGRNRLIQSQSNTICLQQNAVMSLPNAIAPSGRNREFKPIFVFGHTISNYSMQIYDRYGGKIFETSDYQASWSGTKDGQNVPQGVYVYVIQFTQEDGKVVKEKGTVTVIY